MSYIAVPLSRSFLRASHFLKKFCLVGEGSTEGFLWILSPVFWSAGLLFKEHVEEGVKIPLLVWSGVLILKDVCLLSLTSFGQNLVVSSTCISSRYMWFSFWDLCWGKKVWGAPEAVVAVCGCFSLFLSYRNRYSTVVVYSSFVLM